MAPVYPSDLVSYVVKIVPPLKVFSQYNRRSGFDKWSLERRQAENTILGDLGDSCLIHIDVWRCFQYKDSGFGELGGLSFCSEIPCSTRRDFVSCPQAVFITMYECSKSNGNIVVMTKNTCYFRLDRVWNIHVETTENSISRFLDFNIFWGSMQFAPRNL